MALSITPRLIIEAAKRRNWKSTILSEQHALYLLTLPDGRYFYIRNISNVKTGSVNVFISSRKQIVQDIAAGLGIPIPPTLVCIRNKAYPAEEFLAEHGRIVVKPSDQSHGDGVTVDVATSEELQKALDHAFGYTNTVLLQKQIVGEDYRVLLIGDRLAAAAIRKPAAVTGDGKRTVLELIEAENKNPERGQGYEKRFTFIDVDEAARYLKKRLHEVLPEGQYQQVVNTPNIGKGGYAVDITDTIDPLIVKQAMKLSEHLGMGISGVDFIVSEEGAFFIEINSKPSLGLHEYPAVGKGRNTPDQFLNWLTTTT